MRPLTRRSIFASFLVLVAATSAFAAEAFAVVGVYESNGDIMRIVTATDPKQKAAVFVVDVSRLNKPTVRVLLGFPGGPEDWRRFEQLWLKARRTAPPSNGANDTEIGSYFDRLANTQITVHALSKGSVEFVLVSKPEGELVASLLEIEPKDLERFDRDVKTLADYFKD